MAAERDAAVCDLMASALARFGAVRMKVLGTSMLPTIWPGDVLSIEKTSVFDLSPSDVIVFRRGSRLYAHRLVMSDEGLLLATKGDALDEPDAPVQPTDVLGRVHRISRGPFLLDPRAPAARGWRMALALAQCGSMIRRLLARVTRRGSASRAAEAG